jgi:hypothetical protein
MTPRPGSETRAKGASDSDEALQASWAALSRIIAHMVLKELQREAEEAKPKGRRRGTRRA